MATWQPGMDRRHFLGASEVAAVLGISTYKTPRDVWREKVADAPSPQVDTEDMLRGRASEQVIDALLQLRGETLQPGGEVAIAGTPLVVHPDRIRETALGVEVVEFKAPRRWSGWSDDAPPQEYVVQVLVQAFACRAAACRIVALCGDLRDYPIAWQPDVAERLVELATRWWDHHVVGGNEPPPMSRREIAQVVPALTSLKVTDDVVRLLRRLKGLKALARAATNAAHKTELAIYGSIMTEGDLPVQLTDGAGAPVAAIHHRKRASYVAAESEWNEIRVEKAIPSITLDASTLLSDETD